MIFQRDKNNFICCILPARSVTLFSQWLQQGFTSLEINPHELRDEISISHHYRMFGTGFFVFFLGRAFSIMKTKNKPKNAQINSGLIYYWSIPPTCFGQYFAHHQERETEIFTEYGILLLWWVGRRWAVALHYVYSTHSATQPLTLSLPTTTTGYHTL